MCNDDGCLVIKHEEYRAKFILRLNIQELFYGKYENCIDPAFPVQHYTRLQRIKKIVKILRNYSYENEEEIKGFKDWLESEISFYKGKEKKDTKKINLLEKVLKEVLV